jgi:hypothetical protein
MRAALESTWTEPLALIGNASVQKSWGKTTRPAEAFSIRTLTQAVKVAPGVPGGSSATRREFGQDSSCEVTASSLKDVPVAGSPLRNPLCHHQLQGSTPQGWSTGSVGGSPGPQACRATSRPVRPQRYYELTHVRTYSRIENWNGVSGSPSPSPGRRAPAEPSWHLGDGNRSRRSRRSGRRR